VEGWSVGFCVVQRWARALLRNVQDASHHHLVTTSSSYVSHHHERGRYNVFHTYMSAAQRARCADGGGGGCGCEQRVMVRGCYERGVETLHAWKGEGERGIDRRPRVGIKPHVEGERCFKLCGDSAMTCFICGTVSL
jgi:hypothetical protein